MKNPLFSPDPAEELNAKIQAFAPHLFLLAHYNPATDILGETETFTRAALNLYRFMIDAGILSKLPKILNGFVTGAALKNLNKIKTISHDSDTLRTYLAHNCDERNATQQTIKNMQTWIYSATGKRQLSTEDYNLACEHVEREAKEAFDATRKIITAIATHKRAKEIKTRLENELCNYYTGTVGSSIICGQIHMCRIAYNSRWINCGDYHCAADFARQWAQYQKGFTQSTTQKPLTLYQKDLIKRMKERVKEEHESVDTLLPEGLLQKLIIEDMNALPSPRFL